MRTILFFLFAQCGIFLCESYAQQAEVMVLGTAQDAGRPQAGCEATCCIGIDKEPVASLAFSNGHSFFIIDATPDFTAQFERAKTHFSGQTFGGIFLTHAHIGHYTGLMYLGREAMGAEKTPVYVLPRLKKFLEENGPWAQLVQLNNIELMLLEPDVKVQLGAVSVTPFIVPHRDEYSETAGYLLESEKRLLYIPDIDKWSQWDRDILSETKRCDYALLDATFYSPQELPGRDLSEIPHPLVSESLELFKQLRMDERQRVNFIHLNHSNPLFNPFSSAYEQVIQAGCNLAFTGQVFLL
jgi:pyrroloquinoline quinone biosynthesis protein B